jgi:hypothetical protein
MEQIIGDGCPDRDPSRELLYPPRNGGRGHGNFTGCHPNSIAFGSPGTRVRLGNPSCRWGIVNERV